MSDVAALLSAAGTECTFVPGDLARSGRLAVWHVRGALRPGATALDAVAGPEAMAEGSGSVAGPDRSDE
ncbi:MAG: hypothetical protein H0U29_07415, partial [Acidimicrobiia bacterium]|nr:hypothetical protein [Acidimicrobiia bacterium]